MTTSSRFFPTILIIGALVLGCQRPPEGLVKSCNEALSRDAPEIAFLIENVHSDDSSVHELLTALDAATSSSQDLVNSIFQLSFLASKARSPIHPLQSKVELVESGEPAVIIVNRRGKTPPRTLVNVDGRWLLPLVALDDVGLGEILNLPRQPAIDELRKFADTFRRASSLVRNDESTEIPEAEALVRAFERFDTAEWADEISQEQGRDSSFAHSWARTPLEEAVKSRDLALVRSLLRAGQVLNTRDVHAPQGALALASARDGFMALAIIEALGLSVDRNASGAREDAISYSGGSFSFGGRTLDLPRARDQTRIEWPLSAIRFPAPRRSAVLSMSVENRARFSTGGNMSGAVHPSRFPSNLEAWRRFLGPRPDLKPGEVTPIITCTLVTWAPGYPESAIEAIEKSAKPIFLQPPDEATVAELAAVLNAVHVEAEKRPIQLGIDIDTAPRVAPLLTEGPQAPLLRLKLDARASWSQIKPYLAELPLHGFDAMLLTRLDLTGRSDIDKSFYPGGLPGGLWVPLAGAR